MRASIVVIRPGFNSSKSRFYPADVLKRDFKVFEGQKMFLNHQTDQEEHTRPEGRLQDWVANLQGVHAETDGTLRGTASVIDPSFKEKLRNLREAGLLHEMGVSIRAYGNTKKSEIQGVKTNFVEGFTQAKSVDFVTYPGAGGGVAAISESAADGEFVDVCGLVESAEESFEAGTQIGECVDFNKLCERMARKPGFHGDEKSVSDFMRAGFNRNAAEALASAVDEGDDPRAVLEHWATILDRR